MSALHSRPKVAIALGACLAFFSRPAFASDTYPDAIKADLMAAASPGCDLCHNGGNGQKGNVTTPFGKAATALGLVSNDEGTLKTVLAAMQAANDDSDGDGTSDIDELVKGTNPNFNEITGKAPNGADVAPPEYGCRVSRRRPTSSSEASLGVWAVALLLLALGRRWPVATRCGVLRIGRMGDESR
jgi:hypothetical protein